MRTILFYFPGNEKLAQSLAEQTNFPLGKLEIRKFPDGETLVKILSDVQGQRVVIVCSLDRPDDKFLPLYFICKTLKELGASHVTLVAPYLAYMRQDKRFHEGEAVTSDAFAILLSGFIDRLITVDPHLHRHHSLSEIYSVPTTVLPAAEVIAEWIKVNIQKPLLIGPDEESGQWVKEVAKLANVPFEILLKNRKGDNEVEVSVPHVDQYHDCTPVLIDDIISTAHTMMETVKHLLIFDMQAPVCIGVHGVFAGNAFSNLKNTGVKEIISCNTIEHASNKIDLSGLISQSIE